jgi:alkylmercury lyase
MTEPDRIDSLADRLTAAVPRLDPAEQQIAVALLRLLAHGGPVSVGRLAETLVLPEVQVAETLDRLPDLFRDEHRAIIGFMGLSVLEMGDHRIHVNGRALSAWCAWDTLFLPELLGDSARVTSSCPTSGQDISLTVTPAGPTELHPAETVVSFLVRETPFDVDVIQSFCHFVHFFASPQAGGRWTGEHPGTFLVSVRDAFQLGRRLNHARLGGALAQERTPALAATGDAWLR